MNILLFTERDKVRQAVLESTANTAYRMSPISMGDLTVLKEPELYSLFISDIQSWQRCASVFRYFGMLRWLNDMPVVILSLSEMDVHPKFRGPKTSTHRCAFPIHPDEFNPTLEMVAASLSGN